MLATLPILTFSSFRGRAQMSILRSQIKFLMLFLLDFLTLQRHPDHKQSSPQSLHNKDIFSQFQVLQAIQGNCSFWFRWLQKQQWHKFWLFVLGFFPLFQLCTISLERGGLWIAVLLFSTVLGGKMIMWGRLALPGWQLVSELYNNTSPQHWKAFKTFPFCLQPFP